MIHDALRRNIIEFAAVAFVFRLHAARCNSKFLVMCVTRICKSRCELCSSSISPVRLKPCIKFGHKFKLYLVYLMFCVKNKSVYSCILIQFILPLLHVWVIIEKKRLFLIDVSKKPSNFRQGFNAMHISLYLHKSKVSQAWFISVSFLKPSVNMRRDSCLHKVLTAELCGGVFALWINDHLENMTPTMREGSVTFYGDP
jgi:hypothetical protein